MAKFEVKKVMRDKFTRVVFGPGEIRELTQKRADEINKALPGTLEPYSDEVNIEINATKIAEATTEKEVLKPTTKDKAKAE